MFVLTLEVLHAALGKQEDNPGPLIMKKETLLQNKAAQTEILK